MQRQAWLGHGLSDVPMKGEKVEARAGHFQLQAMNTVYSTESTFLDRTKFLAGAVLSPIRSGIGNIVQSFGSGASYIASVQS